MVSPYNRSEDGRYFDGDAGVSWEFDHVHLKASDVRSYAEEGEHRDTVYASSRTVRVVMMIIWLTTAQEINTQIPLQTRQRTLPLCLARRLSLHINQRNQPPNRLLQILPLQFLQRPLPRALHLRPFLPVSHRHHNSRRALLRRRECTLTYA